MESQVVGAVKCYPLELDEAMEELVGDVLATDGDDGELWDLANDIQEMLNKWK